MNGWIKLHRSVLENDVWLNDPVAWRIFEYLLLRAYSGKPQGTVSTGRHKIGNATLVNNNTVYSAIRRLEKAKMITTSTTKQATTFYICNWHEYQQSGQQVQQQQSNNRATTEQHSYKNKKEIKNKPKGFVFRKKELEKELLDFVDMRKQIRTPLTQRAVELLENKLDSIYPENIEKQRECLNQSIENGWKSVYEIKKSTSIDELEISKGAWA